MKEEEKGLHADWLRKDTGRRRSRRRGTQGRYRVKEVDGRQGMKQGGNDVHLSLLFSICGSFLVAFFPGNCRSSCLILVTEVGGY